MIFDTPDLVILGLIILSILIGIIRGFVKESISLVTWVIAIVLAVTFSSGLSEHLTFTKVPLIRMLLAFLFIFVGTVFIGAMVNFMIGSLVRKTPFSIPDRVLGSIFGLLRGMALVTVLILLAALTPLPEKPWWQESYFISRFQVVSIWLKERLPEEHADVFHFPHETPKPKKSKNLIDNKNFENKNIENKNNDKKEKIKL